MNFGAFLVFIALSYFGTEANGAPTTLTYQGRILRSDGTPLEHSNVSFIFQITNPSGQCIIYQEQVTGVNMTNSKGVFDVPIGAGLINFPLSGGFTVLNAFNNSTSYTCGACVGYSCVNGTSTYTPLSSDSRVLRVQFHDGSGWRTISPDNLIRSVPFSGYALSAQKLGTNVASDFLLKAGLPTCASNQYLSWNGTALICATSSAASSLSTGLLSSTDWNTFNNKLDSSSSISMSQLPTVPVSKGGTGVTSMTPNRLLASDASGSAVTTFNCGVGQLVSFDALGVMGCINVSSLGMFANGGNSFSANAVLGTNDNFSVSFATNGIRRMTVTADGKVGILTTTPNSALTVGGRVESTTGGFKFPDGSVQTTAASASVLPKIITFSGVSGVTTSSAPSYVTMSTRTWTAPATGMVLMTYYKIAPYIFSCASGNLGFRFTVDGATGFMGNHAFITGVHRYQNGEAVFPPMVDTFNVTEGTTYTIATQYFTQSFSSCLFNSHGNSSGQDTIVIQYVQ
ncbi:hypothetical protein [Bdellovibrio bacteriovorus]|uniref:hypothetical protein n=1 Tax=Bdellovibrio bacteriovorus TaxID=959 RepID=UPI0035A63F6A